MTNAQSNFGASGSYILPGSADLVQVQAETWKEWTVYSQAAHYVLPYVDAIAKGESLVPNTFYRCILEIEFGNGGIGFKTYVEAGTPFSIVADYVRVKAFSINRRFGTMYRGAPAITGCKVKCAITEGRGAPLPSLWSYDTFDDATGMRAGVLFPFREQSLMTGGSVLELDFINNGAASANVVVADGIINPYPVSDAALNSAAWLSGVSGGDENQVDRFAVAAGEKFSVTYGDAGLAFQNHLYWYAPVGSAILARARLMPMVGGL